MRQRWYRPTMLGLTLVLVAIGLVLFALRWQAFESRGFVGIDHRTHVIYAERFFDTGSMYFPYQLVGPYEPQPAPYSAEIMPAVYPPHAIYLFAPFMVLPAILWWAVPLGLAAYVIVRFRPAPWAWPVMALFLALPNTLSAIIAGNTTMWLVAFVAAGLRWHWPAVLVTLKPSLAPFALIGIRHRSWWSGAALVSVLSLGMLPLWVDYVSVVRYAGHDPLFSLGSVPALLIPVVAWWARNRRDPA